jgi:hypothetical protein
MKRVAWRARGNVWPEYAELECFACHHDLTTPEQSWRQDLGYAGRRAGDPPFNASRFAVFRHLAEKVDPAVAKQLSADVQQVHAQMSKLSADRQQIAQSADAAAATAGALVKSLASQPVTRETTLATMRAIAADADHLAASGERTAEHAALAVDSMFLALSQSGGVPNQAAVRSAIDGLFKELQNPSAYNAPRFAAQLKRVRAALQ